MLSPPDRLRPMDPSRFPNRIKAVVTTPAPPPQTPQSMVMSRGGTMAHPINGRSIREGLIFFRVPMRTKLHPHNTKGDPSHFLSHRAFNYHSLP